MVPRLILRLTSLTATKPWNSLVRPSVSRMTSSAMRTRLRPARSPRAARLRDGVAERPAASQLPAAPFWQESQGLVDSSKGGDSSLCPDAVASAEVEARDGVEVGAGDADDPRLLRVRGRVDDARPVGTRLARTDAIARGGLEHRAVLALGIDSAPFGHLGDGAGIAVDRPRGAVAVRLAGLAALLHVGEHVH